MCLGALAAAAGLFTGTTAFAQQSEITVWAWASYTPSLVAEYEAEFPDRKVNLINPGAGAELYLKLRNALRAGSGLPDVSQIAFSMVPSFAITKSLTDLAPYGLAKHQSEFIPWTWKQLTDGDKLYSMPWDIGPLAMFYRQDIFDKYGLAVPKTWQEFLDDGEKLRGQTKDVYMTSGNFNQPDWFNSMVWQAGGRLYAVDGENVTIKLNGPEAQKVAGLWQTMLDKGYVDAAPSYNTDWFARMDAGQYASWIAPKWAATRLTAASSASMGKWRIAPLPQWQAGDKAYGDWGGSVLIVPKGAAHPEAAAQFIEWVLAGKGAELSSSKGGLWPTKLAILDAPGFMDQSNELFGDQKINPIFFDAAANVSLDWQYSPFQDFIDPQIADKLSAAATGATTLPKALDALQAAATDYAQQQGFTVK
jgi:multiple sugar transport system substrate-binding protein